jgi:hypothetical protein
MDLNAKLYFFYLSFQIQAAKAGKNCIYHDSVIFLTGFMLMLMLFIMPMTMATVVMTMMIIFILLMPMSALFFQTLLFIVLFMKMGMRMSVSIVGMTFRFSLKRLLLFSEIVLNFDGWLLINIPQIPWSFFLHLNMILSLNEQFV